MKFWIDYSDGRYSLHPILPDRDGGSGGTPTITLEGADLERWQRHIQEEEYWYARFLEIDNAFWERNRS